MLVSRNLLRDFFLAKKREKAKLEAELKLQVTLRLIVPAGEAKNISPLNIIGGQYYLNMPEFCNEFNECSEMWQLGVPLPVIIRKGLRAKEFDLFIKPPITSFCADLLCGRDSNAVYFLDLWAFIKLKQRGTTMDELSVAKLVFYALNYNIFFDEEIALKDQLQYEEDLLNSAISKTVIEDDTNLEKEDNELYM